MKTEKHPMTKYICVFVYRFLKEHPAISQNEFARMAGVSEGAIRYILKMEGRATPHFKTVQKLMDAVTTKDETS